MSLDFYLKGKEQTVKCVCDKCYTEHTYRDSPTLYDANITHNLAQMADEAGVYYALWRPEEKKYTKAKQLIPILEKGLEKLKADPKHFEKFNASNGWGTYEHFVPFVEEVLDACREHPNAKPYASR